MNKVGILGAGTWGIALAKMLANSGHDVTVWSALPAEIDELSKSRKHKNLSGMTIPQSVSFTKDVQKVTGEKEILLCAVPSVFVRPTMNAVKQFVPEGQIIVDVAKGIEQDTLLTMTQIISDVIPKAKVVALSGPTHAEEVAFDMPTTIVSACSDMKVAEKVQDIFMNTCMRVYTNVDILGVELCGALKNVIALASGICSGLGYGDNTRAALITRGMEEITKLGVKMGCMEQTFYGLSGIGDLIVTATSNHSRNNKCGYLIGKGLSVKDAIKQVGMVVEGINAIPAAMKLQSRYGVELPIISAVNDVVNNGADPRETVRKLMSRDKRSELSQSILDINFEKAIINNGRSTGMKRVITYGTFDLLHYGHINLLKRAKALGDYLIVAISTDEFNWNEKHKKTYFTYEQRKQLLEALRYVDLVIPEDNWQQKKTDMHEYHIDTFVMGDDWKGKFDFLKDEGVEVVYLPRTPEISTSQIKKDLYDANDTQDTKTSHDDIDTNPN